MPPEKNAEKMSDRDERNEGNERLRLQFVGFVVMFTFFLSSCVKQSVNASIVSQNTQG